MLGPSPVRDPSAYCIKGIFDIPTTLTGLASGHAVSSIDSSVQF